MVVADSSRVHVSPSLLSADYMRLAEEVAALEQAGADSLHLDVMDGHFVPNLTFGPGLVRALSRCTRLPLDVHLMIAPADPYLEMFAEAGAFRLTIHPEAGPHVHRSLESIKKLGLEAGLALNPSTPVSALDHVLPLLDLVLVMTVNPGFGGQSYIPLESKIEAVRARITESNRAIALQVDGGITPETAVHVTRAGADHLVAGTAIFKNGPAGYAAAIQALREAGQ